MKRTITFLLIFMMACVSMAQAKTYTCVVDGAVSYTETNSSTGDSPTLTYIVLDCEGEDVPKKGDKVKVRVITKKPKAIEGC